MKIFKKTLKINKNLQIDEIYAMLSKVFHSHQVPSYQISNQSILIFFDGRTAKYVVNGTLSVFGPYYIFIRYLKKQMNIHFNISENVHYTNPQQSFTII